MSTIAEKSMRLTLEPEIVQWPETHHVFVEKQGPTIGLKASTIASTGGSNAEEQYQDHNSTIGCFHVFGLPDLFTSAG